MQIVSESFLSAINGVDKLALVAQTKTNNKKTGNIPSMWLTLDGANPAEIYRLGMDGYVCGGCKRRSKKSGGDGSCYTNGTELFFGANALWKKSNTWQKVNIVDMCNKIYDDSKKKIIRMLRHGDSSAIPSDIIDTISSSFEILGYTHGWRARQDLAYTHMASVDSKPELLEAIDLGWRTFRAIKKGEELHNSEIMCLNYSSGIQCEKCMACTGNRCAGNIMKNIAIPEH